MQYLIYENIISFICIYILASLTTLLQFFPSIQFYLTLTQDQASAPHSAAFHLALLFKMLSLSTFFSAMSVISFWMSLHQTGIVLVISELLSPWYRSIMRPRPRVPKNVFRFLDLPPEIRVMVYDFYFAPHRKDWYRKPVEQIPLHPGAIFKVNQQIHQEASHALYSKLSPVVIIDGTVNVWSGRNSYGRSLQRSAHVLEYMHDICLDLQWPCYYCQGDDLQCQYAIQLETNIAAVCTLLAEMPNLQTARIFCLGVPQHQMSSLLRPLMIVRRANPRLTLEVPYDCPVTAEELAKH